MSLPAGAVVALNSGSSSLKASVRTAAEAPPVTSVLVERLGSPEGTLRVDGGAPAPFSGGPEQAVAAVAESMADSGTAPIAIAHRIVHGGPKHQRSAVIDDALLADLRDAVPLAPLHLPGALDLIRFATQQWPDAEHVACFDTAFHRDLPEASRRLPVPPDLVELGVRRYGFHGLSVESVLLTRPGLGNVVVAHLGSGCSVTAVDAAGRPQQTTMSMTPTAGMMSATRTGDLDPLVPLYLIEHHGLSVDELRDAFDGRSGLAGVADGRHDVRDLEAANDAHGRLALEMFERSAAMAIAACATTLERWDSLVFTGGVGEHQHDVRDRICARLRLAGVRVVVVPADEELVMDRDARSLLQR